MHYAKDDVIQVYNLVQVITGNFPMFSRGTIRVIRVSRTSGLLYVFLVAATNKTGQTVQIFIQSKIGHMKADSQPDWIISQPSFSQENSCSVAVKTAL